MASRSIFLAVFLALLPLTTLADSFPPALAPIGDRICNTVECGKGTCKPDIGRPFGFTCECDNGWKRSDDDDVDDDLTFLPCIIPKCTMNYTCQPAPPPVPEKEVPHNRSIFNPCTYIYCGEGECKRGDDLRHRCECRSGFENLLNISYFPCYSACTIGSDCSRLGIKVANSEGSPAEAGSGSSGASTSFSPGKLHRMAALVMSMALVLRNY